MSNYNEIRHHLSQYFSPVFFGVQSNVNESHSESLIYHTQIQSTLPPLMFLLTCNMCRLVTKHATSIFINLSGNKKKTITVFALFDTIVVID